jgi:hypothetical protein
VKPCSDGPTIANTSSTNGKGNERGLAGIFGCIAVWGKHPPTRSPHHPSVPPDKQFKSRLIAGLHETIK